MRFEVPEQKKLIHDMTLPIRWGEMDALQHLNNVRYFEYMEVIRVDWMHGLGCFRNDNIEGPVIVNAFCNFLQQVNYPSTLILKLYATAPGRSSFDTFTTIEQAHQPGVLAAAGGATVVWTSYEQQKSLPLPDHIRQAIS